MKKTEKVTFVSSLKLLSKEAFGVLKYGVGCVIVAAIALTIKLYLAAKTDYFGACVYYAPMFEYIMMTLLIVIGGAILFDIFDKKKEQ